MLYDPGVCPNPNEFNPDRFDRSEEEMQKTKELLFGFGRRICYFAENILFSIIASVFATREVLPGLHKTSDLDVLPEIMYTGSSIRLASAFMVCKWYVEILLTLLQAFCSRLRLGYDLGPIRLQHFWLRLSRKRERSTMKA